MKIHNNLYVFLLTILSLSFAISSCDKIEDTRQYPLTLSFESAGTSVQAETGIYNLKIKLSDITNKDITAKVNFQGTAILGEHYSVASTDVVIKSGTADVILPITIINGNIFDELLEIKIILSPSKDYAVDPSKNPIFKLNLTKVVILPEMSFAVNTGKLHSNPFLGETINFELALSEPLRKDSQVRLNVEGGLTLGADFTVNGGNNNTLTILKGLSKVNFELKIRKRDAAGFNDNIKITLVPIDNKVFIASSGKSVFNLKVSDPVINFTPYLKSVALLSGAGFIEEQAIRTTDGTWAGKVAVNMDKNPMKANYLKTFKNMSYQSAFGCNNNSPGGDVLRLAELLVFANTDTVIADYGVGKTTRFFSPSDSLLRFVAEGENILKGTVTALPQKFIAKIVKKVDWETGTNGNKQWHLDSKSTNGDITKSTYPLVFDEIQINLDKLEGTFNMEGTIPEIVFDVWFSSTSKYFMKNVPISHAITKEGNSYKISYRITPK